MTTTIKTADGYIRVSQVKGRDKDDEDTGQTAESFISPEVQREKIEEWARLRGVEIVRWHTDLDESGGKLERPGLTRAIERIESGETECIAVAKLDRFSRLGVADALKLVEQIHKAGGSIAAIDLGIDPTTPVGELMMTLMLALARMERRRLADNYAEAAARALADGVHIAPAPVGYTRTGKRSRLVPDEHVAPLVRECFEQRARNESWESIAAFMHEHGVAISRSGVQAMIKNRAYLGEARGGRDGVPNPDAHERIVTLDEWEAAQNQGRKYARDGSIAAHGMLSGLITCAGCGHVLSVIGGGTRRGPNGERMPSYFCKGSHAAGRCPAPGGARVALVDNFVRRAISQALGDGTLEGTIDSIARYERACEAVAKAQRDLDAIKANPKLIASLGVEGVAELAEGQKAVLDAAKLALRETPEPANAIAPDQHLWVDAEAWPIEKQRQLARQFIAEVTLTRSGKGRGSGPVHERLSIRWVGHDEPDATIAERVQETQEMARRLLAA